MGISNQRRLQRNITAEPLEIRRNLSALSITNVTFDSEKLEISGDVDDSQHFNVTVDCDSTSGDVITGSFTLRAPYTIPGTYTVTISAAGFTSGGQSHTGNEVSFTYTVEVPATSFENLKFENGFLTGTAMQGENPQAGLSVSLSYTDEYGDDEIEYADSNGHFEFDLATYGPGTYTVYIRDYTHIGEWHPFTFTVPNPPPGSGEGPGGGAGALTAYDDTDDLFATGGVAL